MGRKKQEPVTAETLAMDLAWKANWTACRYVEERFGHDRLSRIVSGPVLEALEHDWYLGNKGNDDGEVSRWILATMRTVAAETLAKVQALIDARMAAVETTLGVEPDEDDLEDESVPDPTITLVA